VRDKHGQLHLSKAAKEFHPGAGVYRSSYKNALRLSRTENNMAYRAADHERWQQLDFVVGIEVKLSNNHTINGVPFTDICDDLKGKYPKDFKFSGWHPQCRCHAVPILKTVDEVMAENERIMKGEEPTSDSVNAVGDVPKNFTQWVEKNSERIAQAEERGKVPYFIRDNREFVNPDGSSRSRKSSEKNSSSSGKSNSKGNGKSNGRSSEKGGGNEGGNKQYVENLREVEKKLGIKRGKEMSFEEANELRGNINFYNGKGDEYKINCQCCVVANELRRRGFDVTAMPNFNKKGSITEKLSLKTEDAWVDPKTGRTPKKVKAGGAAKDADGKVIFTNGREKVKSLKELQKEFIELTKDEGRYHIDFDFKKSKSAHIITVEKSARGGYNFYDPQNGKKVIWNELREKISLSCGVYILRVDGLLINTGKIDSIVTSI
jgi:hypothetical protein